MKDQARGFVIATIVLAIALPVLYVGTEGAWYLATGKSQFATPSAYRTLYAPLDWAGERWPRLYVGREFLANGWLRLSGDRSRRASVRELPAPWYGPPAEFVLRRAAASTQQERDATSPSESVELAAESSRFSSASYVESDPAETRP